MKIKDIISLLDAQLLTPNANLDTHVYTACGSDMMSDVLAYVKDQAVLLTGLNNPQVVRTADMMDMKCVVFVRGKRPDDMLITLAADKGIAVLSTDKTMFTACGLLFQNGLHGGKG
ncbi:MAG: DRTGG domain-containing protein [Oscillospiraceae bacterium]